MSERMLEIKHLYAGYGSGDVLQDVNCILRKGEILAVIGRNGVGKSTLMKSLVGILPARKGAIILNNEDITNAPAKWRARKGIGFVPQGREIFPDLTVAENLMVGEQVGISKRSRTLRYEMVYEYFPILKARRDQRGGTLSGGQQQMLALARALVGDPDLLLLDEPSVGIQPSIIKQIGNSLYKLNKEEGLTIFMVEQNIGLIEAVATRAYSMDKGRIVAELTRGDIEDREALTRHLAV